MIPKKTYTLFDINENNFIDLFPDIPKFRYTQISNWIYKNFITSPFEMKNLPKNLVDQIDKKVIWESPKIIKQEKTSDKTEKFLIELHDSEKIEFVHITTPERNTFCLSSQVGCPVSCKFCASGAYGLTRNLSPGEILSQFILGSKILKKYPDNIVFMGIGEPLLNLNNLIHSLDIICSPNHINYATRRVTISTSGIPNGIIRLADLKKQWNLAISLHAPDDETRALLIPEKCRYPINDILKSAEYYYKKSNRIITLEYTLIKGMNDSLEQARALSKIAGQLHAKVNLIPYNMVQTSDFNTPSRKTCLNFANNLKKNGINTTLRIEKGSKINAACGQLRIKNS